VTPLNERAVTLLKTPDGQEILASQPAQDRTAEPDSDVGIHFDEKDILLFDQSNGARIGAGAGP